MATSKRVLFIGLAPEVVDYTKWPGLTAEKLLASLRADQQTLNGLGYEVSLCLVDRGETAEVVVEQALQTQSFDCIMIGAGVRVDADHFLLFETLVNVVHRHATGAAICFNTGPTDSAAAVQRWI